MFSRRPAAKSTSGPARPRVVLQSYSWGEICCRIASGLADHADVLLILSTEQAEPYQHLLDERVELVTVALPRLRQPVAQFRAQMQAFKAIRRFNPDVVHVQHGHFWFNMVMPLLRRYGYPLVISIHDPRHHLGDKSSQRSPQWMFDFGFRKADVIIAHTPAMRDVIIDEIGISPDQIEVVPLPAVGDPSLAPAVSEESNSVLWFGRIWKYKGLDLLIDAQPEINRRVPEARFVIAGRGEDFAQYRQAMVDPERFDVHNHFISETELAALFSQASVVVLPYREATQSAVVVLAYTFGKPVVATNVGGLADQVDHGVTGLLVPPDDRQALADAVAKLLVDDELRTKMGQAGKEKLDKEWSPEAIATSIMKVYDKAASMIDGHAVGSATAAAENSSAS
ncbi:MAG: glycosyltransferase family 4 protein [Acidimicrobiales bacterium]